MAQPPKGKPRLAPGQAAPPGRPRASPFTRFPSPFERHFDFRDEGASLRQTVKIGGQTYREIDNGRANVLVPVDNPLRPPALVAQQQKAIVDSLFMADNPIAGGAYGVAALFGVSPRTRERVKAAGAMIDAGLAVATPRNSPIRRSAPPGKPVSTEPRNGAVRYRPTNASHQSQGMNAVLEASMLGTGSGTKRRIKPPGFVSGNEPYFHDRGHLLGGQLGGHADSLEKVFTAQRTPTNGHWMRDFENEVARRVAGGEIVDYGVTPLYSPGVAAPTAILLNASGDRAPPVAKVIGNRPKPPADDH